MKTAAANPVAWTEGMFLRPQHLQQQDQYWEGRLRDQLRSLDPFHWGVRALEINEEALSDHRFEVLRLEAILPGGVPLRYPGGCTLEMRDFNPAAEAVDVWVGLRRPSAGEPSNAPLESAARDVRYHVRSDEVPDLNRGGAEAAVDFLVPNARLLLSGQELELEQHDAFKLARVVATGELKRPFAIAGDYAPPLLSVQAFAPLDEHIQKVVSQLAARIRVVAGRTATIAIADLPRMWMRYTLARVTPLLRHLASTGATRPFDLYSALVEAAGALAAFAEAEPLELPSYQHDDLYPRFLALLRLIEKYTDEVVPHRFHEIEMPFDRKAYSTNELSMELADPRNHFFLGIKASIDSKKLASLVEESGKCAAPDDLHSSILILQLKGLGLEHLPAAPTDIAARVGYEYWKLDPHGNAKLWGKVRSGGKLALSLGTLREADVRLYVVSPET